MKQSHKPDIEPKLWSVIIIKNFKIQTNLLKGPEMPKNLTGIKYEGKSTPQGLKQIHKDVVWVWDFHEKNYCGFMLLKSSNLEEELTKILGSYELYEATVEKLNFNSLDYALKGSLIKQNFEVDKNLDNYNRYKISETQDISIKFVRMSDENEINHLYLILDVIDETRTLEKNGLMLTNERFEELNKIISDTFSNSIKFHLGEFEFSFVPELVIWE